MKVLVFILFMTYAFSSFAFCQLKISKAALEMAKLNSAGELEIEFSELNVNSTSYFVFFERKFKTKKIKIEVDSIGDRNFCSIGRVEVL